MGMAAGGDGATMVCNIYSSMLYCTEWIQPVCVLYYCGYEEKNNHDEILLVTPLNRFVRTNIATSQFRSMLSGHLCTSHGSLQLMDGVKRSVIYEYFRSTLLLEENLMWCKIASRMQQSRSPIVFDISHGPQIGADIQISGWFWRRFWCGVCSCPWPSILFFSIAASSTPKPYLTFQMERRLPVIEQHELYIYMLYI